MRFDPNTSVVHLVHRVSQIAAERFAAAVANDLTIRQLTMLAVIEASKFPSQTHLATVTGIDRSTTADIVRRLVMRRLVTRKRARRDARAYELAITADGSRVLSEKLVALEQVERGIAELLSPSQHSALADALTLVVMRANGGAQLA